MISAPARQFRGSSMADLPDGWELVPNAAPRRPILSLPPFDPRLAIGLGGKFGKVTSTARSPQHNADVGGVPNSYHLTTRPGGPRAIDIQRAPGVSHADIDRAYRASGFDLLESLDEGDHSHFAFRSGPTGKAPQSAVPDGWEMLDQQTSPQPPATPAVQPQEPAPPIDPEGEGSIGAFTPMTAKEPTKEAQAYQSEATQAIAGGKVKSAADLDAIARKHGFNFTPDQLGDLDKKFFPALAKNGGSFGVATPKAYDRSMAERLHMVAGSVAATTGDILDVIETANPLTGAKKLADRATLEPALHDEVIRRYGKERGEQLWPQVYEQAFGKSWAERARELTGAPQPATFKERLVDSTIRGATAGALTGGVASMEAGGANLARTMTVDTLAGAGGGAGSEVGREVAGEPGALIGGLVGGGLGYKAAGHVYDNAPRIAETGRRFALDEQGSVPPQPPEGPRRVDRIDINDVPKGWVPVDDPAIGRARPMGEQPKAQDIAAAAERVQPEDVTPIPSNAVENPEELPTSILQVEGPAALGRAPKKPIGFADYLRGIVKDESQRRGVPVRIDAEDAIDKGVPAELVYRNPGVADKAQLQVRNPSLFGTRYGAMSGKQQVLRSLDMDEVDPVAWGFEDRAGGRLDPEDIGNLLRRDLEGDTSALMRGPDYDRWAAHQHAQAAQAEFAGRYPEGAPYERRGETASLEDLAANEPPPSAYEDLVRPGGKVANLNLAKLETRGDIRRALQNVEAHFGGFDAARRGEITHEQTAQLAAELKMTPDDLLKRRQGQALNAEQALAARQILAKSADELVALAAKAKGGSEDDLLAFRKGLVRHAAIQEQVTGATAEAGRALAQFKMLARSKAVPGRILDVMMEGAGGRKGIEEAAEAILDLQRQGADPGTINKFALDATKPKFKDKLVELWINSLLSGPQTHAVNFVSNALTALGQIPEHAVAATLGAGRRAVTGSKDAVLFSEVGARAVGLVSGVKQGLLNGAKTFLTETPSDLVSKIEAQHYHAISGTKGRLIRVPTRALSAADEMFKGIARRSAINGMAVRKAYQEGLRGEAAQARAAELAAHPTDEMVRESFDYARYVTFQRQLGPTAQAVSNLTRRLPALKLVIPFVRTPTNLLKFAVERSPAAPLLKEWRQDFAAGGARRDLAISRAVVGSGVGAMMMLWASEGKITGSGPADQNAKRLMMADGWQPYSVKIGDKYYSYSRLDPFSTTIGMAADLATKNQNARPGHEQAQAAILVASIMKQMESKTWISGLVDMVKAVDDLAKGGREHQARNFLDRMAGSIAVPAAVAQVARTVDPVQRDSADIPGVPDALDSTVSRIMSRIPGLSDNLPARRDVWGRPITGEGGAGPDILSPLWVSTDEHDPVTKEVLRLGETIGELPKKLKGVDLTPEQYAAYAERAGRYTHEDFAKAIADPDWKQMDSASQRKWLEKIKRQARKAAREELQLDESSGVPAGWEAVPAGWEPVSSQQP